jgi:Domain of unknown function (DUF4252)
MKNILAVLFVFITVVCSAQTKTTNELSDKYSSWTVFLYHNTLRMINQNDDKNFDEIIKDIEKVKIVSVNKKEKGFDDSKYKKLINSYKGEQFEEIMTTRIDGRNVNAYILEKKGETKGMVITVNDTESVYVLDMVGKIALNKIMYLLTYVQSNADINDKVQELVRKQVD